MYPLTQIKHSFVLKYIFKKCNEQLTGQSPNTISGSTRSPQRCATSRFLMYACTSTNPVSISVEHLRPALGSSPQRQFCCPKVVPERSLSRTVTTQCCGYFLPHHQGKFHSFTLCHLSLCRSGILASSQFSSAVLQLHLLALHARSFLGHTLPLLSSLNFPFSYNFECSDWSLGDDIINAMEFTFSKLKSKK